jgi:DNA-3-methyladenine glycosylase
MSKTALPPSPRKNANLIPDPRLLFDPKALRLKEFSRDFFRMDTARVAREIIGAWLGRRYRNQWYGARIVETEAYLGRIDAAAHSWQGRRTPRVEPMYQDGGHLYVFFVYGMHHCANVVTQPAGTAEAVLLRAAEGPEGTPVKLLSGPGRLCKALGITAASSGMDLLSARGFRIFRGYSRNIDIGASKRIGIDYAGEAADWVLRFYDRNSKSVSGSARLNL